MKKRLLTLILLLVSSAVYAEPPLTRAIVDSFIDVSTQMSVLEQKYPQVFQRADQFSASEDEAFIRYIKSSKAFPEIKSILSKSKFGSMKNFLATSRRIMGSMYAVQMQQAPEGMKPADMASMMESGILAMKQSGASAEMIAQMRKDMQRQKAELQEMNQAAKNASQQDKKFVSDNLEWLMRAMPEENQ